MTGPLKGHSGVRTPRPSAGVSNDAVEVNGSVLTTWQQAQQRMGAAVQAYASGDPGPFRAAYSHAEDVTVFGGYGGWQKGWSEVEHRTAWSSSQYHGGIDVMEFLAEGCSGDLGYTVHLERITTRIGSSAAVVEKTYRVTHIFRREGSEWKLIHRHADPLIDTQPPT
jgi:ketosteroid isomerase-like protein